MPLEKIDIYILKLIQDFNGGDPVGLQTLDRMLIIDHSDLIYSGKLQEKIDSMEEDHLIYRSSKGGYLLTEY